MTAPEPTRPADEHTDAVARHLPYLVPWERLTEGSRNDYRRKARRIMDDPAVHAAMLDALVRAGVLTEEDEAEWCEVRCPVWSISSDARCSHSCRRSGPHDEHECVDGHTFPYDRFDGPKPARSRRLITPWEVAP